ncbi:ferritin family protein [Desulfobacter latus]|uniref:Rubrerythrin diiron-binding domain-containing protein n=1 Tax=Desulfobacter latus TaxID=2292 RepID=A0A850T7Z7_9BACT|nr:ferritin family protein [Desulfobacter latus]NWH05245.1 hypothetical protein [Desulfobacter latus]
MELKADQEKIIKQLITQEEMLSKLYGHFSEQFPEYSKFWNQLSKEEHRHARLIQKLFDAANRGKIFFDEGKITTYTLNAFISRLEQILHKAMKNEYDIKTALGCAMDYENSLIEKNIFTHFDSSSDNVKRTLNILHSETITHRESIRKVQQTIAGNG